MQITFADLLKNDMFDDCRLLAGSLGLDRVVNRISVFDCPCHEEVLAGGIMEDGDVFITCLEQFEQDRASIMIFLDYLIQYHCSGVLIVATGRPDLMSQEAIDFCDQMALPVVHMKKNVSYATLISTINKYLEVENLNELNRLKLDKIRNHDITIDEQSQLYLSINPRSDEYIQVVYVEGIFRSLFTSAELWQIYQGKRRDCVILEDQIIFIISEASERLLKNRCDALYHEIGQYFESYRIGYSSMGRRREIHRLLDEAEKALYTAQILGRNQHHYDPLQSVQFLLMMKDSISLEEYYDAYLSRMSASISAESFQEILRTIETFVEEGGDFKQTAGRMGQHTNTIRYRINRAKEALGMEDDLIRFHETISLATRIGRIYKKFI